MKSLQLLPVFNSTSAMHRVFGDVQPLTEIHNQENVLGPVLLFRSCDTMCGVVTIRVRSWFWRPTFAPTGTITRRFECYFNGTLVDYTTERTLIVKTLRWLSEKGQIHKTA